MSRLKSGSGYPELGAFTRARDSFDVSVRYIRRWKPKHSTVLLGPNRIKKGNRHLMVPVLLQAKGGCTLVRIYPAGHESPADFIAEGYALCREDEPFVKSIGRDIATSRALGNLATTNHDIGGEG